MQNSVREQSRWLAFPTKFTDITNQNGTLGNLPQWHKIERVITYYYYLLVITKGISFFPVFIVALSGDLSRVA